MNNSRQYSRGTFFGAQCANPPTSGGGQRHSSLEGVPWRPGRLFRRGFFSATALRVLLIGLLLLSGCASRQEALGTAPEDAPVADRQIPAVQQPPVTAPLQARPPAGPVPAVAAGDKSPLAARAEQQPVPPAPAVSETKKAGKKAPASSPVRQMLVSAGRDPGAAQSESGFVLRVPDAVGDGEAFLVEFGASGAESVGLLWRNKNLTLSSRREASGRFQALLPVPLDAKETSFPLEMTVHWADGRQETFTASVPVKKRKYPIQRLKVDSKFVSPPPEMDEKIKRDRAEMRAAVGTFSQRQYWTLPLLRPVPGEVTSLYGSRRVFNGVPKAPHKGVDFDAREGDPIAAVENGVVVLVSEHYYGGNTVVIDHGLGVLSAYLHLSGFNVSTGQQVRRGETIGFIGSTGRVTGPHLHFSLYVLGESLNAAPCLAM